MDAKYFHETNTVLEKNRRKRYFYSVILDLLLSNFKDLSVLI